MSSTILEVSQVARASSINVQRRRSRPKKAITGSGHKQGCLQSHTWGLMSPDFKCVEQLVPSPERTSQKTRAMSQYQLPAVGQGLGLY